MQGPILLGTVFLAAGGAALACALFTVQGNYKPKINREFLAEAGSLVIWNFGRALFGAGADVGVRSIGAHFSAVGYTLSFFFLLRCLLLLTGRQDLFHKSYIRVLLYLPFLVLLCGFVALPLFHPSGITWFYSRWGWIEISKPGLWDFFFCGYYGVFLAVSGRLLLRWVRSSSVMRRRAGWLMGSFIFAAVGGMTDILLPLLQVPCPRMAAVCWVLPVLVTGHSVRRFHLTQDLEDGGMILTDKARHVIYRLFACYLISGGLVNALLQKIFCIEKEIALAYLFSAVLVLIGMILLFLGGFRKTRIPQEFLLAVMAALLIPVILLCFYADGGITVWAFVFPLIVIGLLFNKRVLLVTAVVCASQAQLFLWGICPHAGATVNMTDYITRVILIVATSSVCLSANGIYLNRLRENAMHSAGQLLVSEISRSFLAANEETIEEKIRDMLRKTGAFIQCDQAYIALLNKADRQARFSCEWLAEGAAPARKQLDENIQKLCRVMQTPSNNGHPVIFLDLEDILPEAECLRYSPGGTGAHRLVCLPIQKKEETVGLLLFAGVNSAQLWKSFVFLSIISNIVADTANRLDGMRKIRMMAYHDQLTGLPNRVLFKKQLKQAIADARREETILGIVFIDLDSFKVINDTLGHEAGDRLLKAVAGIFLGQVWGGDIVCRFGGDEFVFLFEQVPHIDVLLRRLETILDALRRPVRVDDQEICIMGSAGVAVFPRDGDTAGTLIKNADMAMYHAKGMGKNRYALCSSEMKDEMARQGEMINLLYRAQEKEQLFLCYQPQVDLKTRRVVGVEALMRWDLPGQGIITPGAFIPLAEQTGLIQPIGEWALLTACRQAARWREMELPPLRMAVNISVQQLASPHFSQRVADILQKTGLPPRYLELEVTESVAYRDIADFPMRLNQLKKLGVSISIDDFGTGYSSFGRIKLLPVDRIKLDIQFVRGIEISAYDRAVADAVIEMAKGLKMKVIAEGMETTAQLEFLSRRMCDEVQGYYYFKPMPAAKIEKLLRENCPVRPAMPEPLNNGVGME
ncbi:sensor domain-containing phosphodiesterase [Ethanoligenens harbinense]|uniref:Diguanylate cyclase/phosphodiesterase n=2 Tax=Ethanoligenens harbinense TaxID=253239 RepID=E6U5I7_ETHHY|nr:EAL domain-containing protein [Ethanoligenens harbinense]ADU25654.1 diguanylate cyclase/phosphodiesterase [Ethanoligenens harbinense YUAN-3]AVQ94831.1 GGDEF-domain containing protein [Ethanoligenens harbinense YUAN-3]AYF40242.1 GGDEF-domain containing protein [Ethanoligenens harbinense]